MTARTGVSNNRYDWEGVKQCLGRVDSGQIFITYVLN